ncbi:MAG: hypothetical protein R3F14_26265 [Polyangiaceae bacterium]
MRARAGAAFDPDTPDEAGVARVWAGASSHDPEAIQFEVTADRATELLCTDGAGACARGFDTMLPVSLLDGKDRVVHVYSVDSWVSGADAEMTASPVSVSCPVFSMAGRVKRRIAGEGAAEAWRLSPFFDELDVVPRDVADVPESAALPGAPELIASEDGSAFWILDGAALRPISEDAMFAFRLDAADATVWGDAKLDRTFEGRPWPSRPVMVRGEGEAVFLLDNAGTPGHFFGASGAEDPGDFSKSAAACGCRSAPGGGESGGGALAVLGVVGLFLAGGRRRVHRGRTTRASVR